MWTSRTRRFEEEALPHLGALHRMARQLVGATGADDLVQETLLRAWKYFETFESETNCRAWLFRILRNAWIARWRKSHLELPWRRRNPKRLNLTTIGSRNSSGRNSRQELSAPFWVCLRTIAWRCSSLMLRDSRTRRSLASWSVLLAP